MAAPFVVWSNYWLIKQGILIWIVPEVNLFTTYANIDTTDKIFMQVVFYIALLNNTCKNKINQKVENTFL